MPHPLVPKAHDPAIAPSPASQGEGGGSPASLLWAYQLRREHKALVSRIDELHNKIGSSATAARTTNDLVTGRLTKLETQIGQLRGDVKEAVSGTVDLFGTLRGELAAENEAKKGRELDYASEWRAKLKELELMVREITEALEREETTSPASSGPICGTPPSAQPCRFEEARRRNTEIPSTVSGTPTTVREKPEDRCQTFSPSERGSDSLDVLTTRVANPATMSPILGGSPDVPDPERLLASLAQRDTSLSSYIELGESVLARFPRKRDEAKVVEAFWEGLADSRIKGSVEQILDRDGWTWKVVLEAAEDFIPDKPPPHPSRLGDNMQGTRRKRKRFIPIVFSNGEEQDNWRIS